MCPDGCPIEVHDALKVDRAKYEAATYVIGWQDCGDGWEIEFANCRVCHSTLNDGTARERMKEAA